MTYKTQSAGKISVEEETSKVRHASSAAFSSNEQWLCGCVTSLHKFPRDSTGTRSINAEVQAY